MPIAPLIESYQHNDFAPPPLVPDIANREEVKSTDFPVRIVTYTIAGVLIIFVTIWWQSQQSETVFDATVESSVDTTAFESSTSASGSEPLDSTAEPSVSDDATISAVSETSDDILVTAALTPPIPLVVESEDSDTLEELAAIVEIGTEVEPIPLPSPGADIAAEVATTAVETIVREPGLNRLKMVFANESWVEVYGQNGKTLFYDIAKSGDTIDLRDTGNFRVILGFSSGVLVEFNDQPFDPALHTVAGVARFTSKPLRSAQKVNPFHSQVNNSE